jgi:hypothetical protein
MGNYTIRVRLKVEVSNAFIDDLFNIEIVDRLNDIVKLNDTFSVNNITLSEWITFEFDIEVKYPSIYEVRSLALSEGFKIYFDYLEIIQKTW